MSHWAARSLATIRKKELPTAAMDFRPLPFLSNPHLQTLLGTFWDGRIPYFPTRERQIILPDGDRLVLHDSRPANWRRGDPIALLIHGLGGTHASGYMRRVTALLLPHGIRVVRMDMRGCGRGAALSRQTYNGASSRDIRAAAEELGHWSPSSPIIVVGFSLGGNIVLKLAGEAADHRLPGLNRVVALAPPIDLVRCAALISSPRNRLYERHFVRNMIIQVRTHQRHFPDLPAVRIPYQATLREFDDLYTAPRGGFADAADYYRRASSLPLVPRIQVPTLILTARDDPFIAVEPFEELRVPSHIEVQISRQGGHLGFLGRDRAGGVRWAERRVTDWVMQCY
jgi:predicted alpha/beta-fold hydrolase